MPVDDAPDDDNVRETYNFAPGNHGLVYRAQAPDHGARQQPQDVNEARIEGDSDVDQREPHAQSDAPGPTRYKLQSMKWGLVPFWTKRSPDYGSVMKTINARDDSLAAKGGMWQTMKQNKRCIVVAQGFYEWLKKNNGKEKIPHFVKRKDEQLMCFAGLWDCVRYEGSDEKHYTYTIITTDSNKQLSFLHDRMPVILENGSEDLRTWLDPGRAEWSGDLQALLKPFQGELECYAVSKEVGKVGNNSPNFVVPVASAENKHNIANFFSNAKKPKERSPLKTESHDARKVSEVLDSDQKAAKEAVEEEESEDNAPRPEPVKAGLKRAPEEPFTFPSSKVQKTEETQSPKKTSQVSPSKKNRSATSNGTGKASPLKSDGNQKISNFFKT